eukprot:m.13828 g.13828  ORF g.13828 m.13828 type:complete len:218 (+) comp4717_c0_seq2:114-767(+)
MARSPTETALAVIGVAALTMRRVDGQALTIVQSSCSDYECQSGCVPANKFLNGSCHPSTFRPGYMTQAYCEPAPGGLCFQMHSYDLKGNLTCANATASDIWGEGCGVCKEEDPNSYSIATGCSTANSTGTITFHRSCPDASCTNCANTLDVPINTCFTQTGGSAILASGPFSCGSEIVFAQFKGTDCKGEPDFQNRMFDAGCFNFDGHAQQFACTES